MDLHLHPMIVHFPIALFISALGFEILSLVLKKDNFHEMASWLYLLAAVIAPFAAWTGLEEAEEHNLVKHPVFDLHRNFALLAVWTALATLPVLWFVKKRAPHLLRIIFLVFLVLVVSAVSIAAYNGGRLVYDYGIGVEEEQ